jgi:hypothetical protein
MKALAAEMCHSVVRKEDLVERYWKQRLVRFIPLIALVIFAAFLGPDKLNRLPGWARWAIFFTLFFPSPCQSSSLVDDPPETHSQRQSMRQLSRGTHVRSGSRCFSFTYMSLSPDRSRS